MYNTNSFMILHIFLLTLMAPRGWWEWTSEAISRAFFAKALNRQDVWVFLHAICVPVTNHLPQKCHASTARFWSRKCSEVKITTLIRTSIHALINALLQIRAQALGQYIKQVPFSNNWLPSSSYFLK